MLSINELANPNECEHDFCKDCLLLWAANSTKCLIIFLLLLFFNFFFLLKI